MSQVIPTPPIKHATFCGFEIEGRAIVTVSDDGEVTIADDATTDDLIAAIMYLIGAVDGLTIGNSARLLHRIHSQEQNEKQT